MSRLRLMQRAMRYRFSHDPCEIREMLRHTPRGGTAIDIGAHKGAYSWWLLNRVGAKGRVVAVEPQTALADRLEANYRGKTNFHLFRGAVSDHTGTGELVVPDAGVSHGATLRGINPTEEGHVATVDTTTLTSLAESMELERVDFIKCDAEGHELAIFRGGLDLLGRDKPGLLIECDASFLANSATPVEDPVGELRSMFEPMGYRGWCIVRNALVPIEKFSYREHQQPNRGKHDGGHNFLFVHPSETGG